MQFSSLPILVLFFWGPQSTDLPNKGKALQLRSSQSPPASEARTVKYHAKTTRQSESRGVQTSASHGLKHADFSARATLVPFKTPKTKVLSHSGRASEGEKETRDEKNDSQKVKKEKEKLLEREGKKGIKQSSSKDPRRSLGSFLFTIDSISRGYFFIDLLILFLC